MTDLDHMLKAAGWAGATRHPMTPDASARSYIRLELADQKAIVMQDPDGDIPRFAQLARHLAHLDLSAPRILYEAPEQGLMLIEDLGDALFARLAQTDPALEPALYDAAVDALIVVAKAPVPEQLARATPQAYAPQIDLAFDPYASAMNAPVSQSDQAALIETLQASLLALPAYPDVLILRDYHAENLLWLPERAGAAKAGLLDFQDAVIGHPAYDLMSLVQDARRDVPAQIADRAIARFAAGLSMPEPDLRAAMAVWGVQRNLRILGIFARLARSRGKPGYIRLIPRVWGHVEACLHHPATAKLAPLVRAHIPAPTPDRLAALLP